MKMVKLGDVLPFHYGKNLPAPKRNHEGSIPVISSAGVIDHHDHSVVPGPVVVIGRKGSVGSVFYSQGPCWPTDTAFYVQGSNRMDIRFAYYLLKNQPLSRMNNDSAVPGLNRGDAEGLVVFIPEEVERQRQIAGVLGALDDKIAANQRVMFVSKGLSASLAGTATRKCALGEISTIYKSPIGVTRMNGKIVTSYSLPSFDDGWAPRIDGGSIKSGKTLLKKPVVLVSKLNPRIPRIWGVDHLPEGDSVASTEFVALKPKDGVKIAHLWSVVSSPDFTKDVLHRVTGTTGSHQRITPQAMMEIEVNDPRGLSEETKILLEPLLRSVNLRAEENQKLARTRDELLPLLMDGRITVKDAERVVEEV
ncbi:restriction endonuclease subunit S [Rothia kristinae]|uniref:restriction endonuclease subunit S n=1 Tax=Rothia kristinae TaxID=37923 RepID=UPI0022E2F52C|nr:restriction endonuclease subunit S [Rothia kristinae]